MKKLIILIVVILVILICALIAAPVLFKPALLNATRNTLNKELQAEVYFKDLKVSLFRNFPNVSLELEDLSITGKVEFAGDTLLNVSSVKAKMNLVSLFKKKGKGISELIFVNPRMNFIVGELGEENWKIEKVSFSPPQQQVIDNDNSGSTAVFDLQLDKIKIENGQIIYEDKSAPMKLIFAGVNFDINGNMYGTSANLELDGGVSNFFFNYAGVDAMSQTTLSIRSQLNVDYEKMVFLISENEVFINRLPLEFNGKIEIPDDSVYFDLEYSTKASDFAGFLALIPPSYEDYLKNVTTDGSASVNGNLKGYYAGENYPGFELNAEILNGSFQMKDLPEKISNIKAQIQIYKPQGGLSLYTINIKEAHAEVKNNPVDMTLKISNLFADAYFDGFFVGKINFSDLKDVLPMDSVNLSGTLDANLDLKGSISSVINKTYDQIKADGVVLLDRFTFQSAEFTLPIYIPTGRLDFTPQHILLKECNINIGESDFTLNGKVEDYFGYLLKDETLKGEVRMNSKFVNFDEIMRLYDPEPETIPQQVKMNTASFFSVSFGSEDEEDDYEEIIAFNIPTNFDFTFNYSAQLAVFNEVSLSNMNGLISIKNGILNLDGLTMSTLGGTVKLTGSYQNTQQNSPLFDLGFDIRNIDIPTAYQSLTSLQRIAPVAGNSSGKISSKFNLKGQLTPDYQIIGKSIDGSGSLQSANLQINNSPIFNQLKGILKSEMLRNVRVDDFNAAFEIINGNMDLKPFQTKIADQEATIYGSLSAENLLNMKLDFKVKRDAFGSDIQNILSILPGNEKIKVLPAGVIIKGPVNNPEVLMDLAEAKKTISDATKGELQNSLEKIGNSLKNLFK